MGYGQNATCNFQDTFLLKEVPFPPHTHTYTLTGTACWAHWWKPQEKDGGVNPSAWVPGLPYLTLDCYVKNKLLLYLSHFILRSLCNSILAIIPTNTLILLDSLSYVFLPVGLFQFNPTSILWESSMWWGSVFQSMVPRPGSSSSPGNLLDMQTHKLYPRLTEWESLGWGSAVGFNKPFRWPGCTLMCKSHCTGA